MFAVQRYSTFYVDSLPRVLWSNIGRHNTYTQGVEALKRVLDPHYGSRPNPKHYRLAAITPGGRTKKVVLRGEDVFV